MSSVKRSLAIKLKEQVGSGKALLVFGARQVGKTTLLQNLFNNSSELLWLNGDDPDVQLLFTNFSAARIKAFLGSKRILVVDEAQRIPDIGLRLKLITDGLPEVQLVVTGSSAFELANRLNEPLTGRKWEHYLFPLSFAEMVAHHGLLEERRLLPHRLVFGSYPEVVSKPGLEKSLLKELCNSYLYKDILMLDQMKKPDALIKLLQALALQMGSQVSYNELSRLCGIDAKTVEKYVLMLEQSFVIFRVGSFSRNLRSELKHSRKIYFYDNGVRNALINDFRQIEIRNDVGALWENYLMAERIKLLAYKGHWANKWFWRTKEQKEIDYLEEANGKLRAFEFKYSPKAKVKIPNAFYANYPEADVEVITSENYDLFLTESFTD